MFELVANFEHYPNFLPFCTGVNSTVIDDNQLHGTLFIHKGPFRKSFTTHNTMQRDHQPPRILIALVDGPFKKLDGQWRFIKTENGCEVTLDLTYDMKSGLLNQALAGVFEWIAKAMVDKFCEEAHKIYS